ncbi:MAG TPA: DUF6194 family protein [Verrucomicrobiae bacterium]|jgi:hypothetical protein
MNEAAITQFISTTFAGVDAVIASAASGAPEISWGDTFFFYDPERTAKASHRFPFATIVTRDYAGFDQASNLDRPGIFRLNLGVDKAAFQSLFGSENVKTGHDFAAVDTIMPHPIYASQFWVCVLNPSETIFRNNVKPLLAVAYDLASGRLAKRSAG